jgi:hypothetical protein
MNKQTIITILLALGTRFAFPFGQRPLVPGFAEGFFVPFSLTLPNKTDEQ